MTWNFVGSFFITQYILPMLTDRVAFVVGKRNRALAFRKGIFLRLAIELTTCQFMLRAPVDRRL